MSARERFADLAEDFMVKSIEGSTPDELGVLVTVIAELTREELDA